MGLPLLLGDGPCRYVYVGGLGLLKRIEVIRDWFLILIEDLWVIMFVLWWEALLIIWVGS
jgi:hypothetical protein